MAQAKLETSCFESMENADFCTASSLYQELKKRISSIQGKVYLFLDEIQEVYNSVLLKDVVQCNNIRDVELLERMILYLLYNVGHSFSARSISNYLKQENRKVSSFESFVNSEECITCSTS